MRSTCCQSKGDAEIMAYKETWYVQPGIDEFENTSLGYSSRIGDMYFFPLELEKDLTRSIRLRLTYDELVTLRDTCNRWIERKSNEGT